MRTATKTWQSLTLTGLALAAAGAVQAVPDYGDIVGVTNDADGVYFGTGNVNGNWTIDTANGIEVALRAKNRSTLATIDGSSGIYHANPGLAVAPGAPKAAWNYEFSVNTQAGGGGAVLNDFIVELGVDTDPGLGMVFTFLDVLNNWPDNAYWNGARTVGANPGATDYGVQQSANPLFGDSGFPPFDVGIPGLYNLQLSVYAKGPQGERGALLAQSGIRVQIPEPATLLLLGMGLTGLGWSACRKAL